SRARLRDARNSGSRSRAYQYISSSSKSLSKATAWPCLVKTTSSFFTCWRTFSNSIPGVISICFIVSSPWSFTASFFQNSQNNHSSLLGIYIVVYAKLINSKAILAPKGLIHRPNAGAANLGGFVKQMRFNTFEEFLLVKTAKSLNVAQRFLCIIDLERFRSHS